MTRLVVLSVILVLTLIALLEYRHEMQHQKLAFVYPDVLFQSFTGTKETQMKLQGELHSFNVAAKRLDSVELLSPASEKPRFEMERQKIALHREQLTERFTAEIWQHINQGVKEYSARQGYTFVFGASGTGSLMYAAEASDITEEVIAYLNETYQSKR